MKYALFIIAAFVSASAVAQSAADLDKKNGFREYTIGTSVSALQEKIDFIKNLEGAETKLFKARETAVIQGLSGEVELAFYKEKLVEITVFFRKTSANDFNDMKKSLTQLYGDPKNESLSKNRPSNLSAFDKTYMWKGAVIGLQLNYDVSHKVIEMIYWGLKETTDKIKEEF